MQARMKNPTMIIPGAMEALQALAESAEKAGVPKSTLDLAHLRARQMAGEWAKSAEAQRWTEKASAAG